MLYILITLIFTCGPTSLAAVYLDSITAQSLIGSHFGIPFFNASFDYVIVGGGTAGLTLATRLAQDSSITVAVIEAGGFSEVDNGNLTAIPADNGYWVGTAPLERNPLIDWEIYTEPMSVRRSSCLPKRIRSNELWSRESVVEGLFTRRARHLEEEVHGIP